ncbi:MAG: hypothetical protein F6K65_09670 [Moorea sp. SIO3C2]|nr:hypothetical protein [Moorena sp. SIO3C2]
MPLSSYSLPVSRLLQYGDCYTPKAWPNYPEEIGLSKEDVPELIRMATDYTLIEANDKSLEVWAPVHAWRSLGQLKAPEAVEPLMKLLEDSPDYAFAENEIPIVIGQIGYPGLEFIFGEKLLDLSNNEDFRCLVVECIANIAYEHPQTKQTCVELLLKYLESYETNDSYFNGYLIVALNKLEVQKAAPLVEETFLSGNVEPYVVQWNEIQDTFGLTLD